MCGIVGVIGSPEASKEAFLGLITLQHRGQDAAGILSFDQSFHLVKNLGLVESVFTRESIDSLHGSMAIGHTRYSTIGRGDLQDVQPLVLNYPYGLGVVHNGNIVNVGPVRDRLQNEMRRRCFTQSDTEVLLNWFAHHLSGSAVADLERAVKTVFKDIRGSYSIVGLLGGSDAQGGPGGGQAPGADGGMIAFRDPNGIRPLVRGKKGKGKSAAYMVASESTPLSFLGYEVVRDIEPGELLYIRQDGKMFSRKLEKPVHRPCMFEWVYFAGAEAIIEQTPVYSARLALGAALAAQIRTKIRKGEMKVDLIAPVPDTARTAAAALAEALKLPYREVLIKNRYIKRTFILGSQQKRKTAVDLKLNPVVSEIKGKNIVLVDDSIVRGTTSKKIIELVRKAGAKKIYFVSTCPPIRFPCFYGIDFPDPAELVAANRTEREIAKQLGADGVVYQNQNGLLESLSRASKRHVNRPCTACLDGKYPTDVSAGVGMATARSVDRKGAKE